MQNKIKFPTLLILSSLYLSTFAVARAESPSTDVLSILADRLGNLKTVQYDYKRELNYYSENYHSEFAGTVYLDFSAQNPAPGFRYQFENESSIMIYNGAESFTLDKKAKTIAINPNPQSGDFNTISFFYNSIVTLRNALPNIIADTAISTSVADTVINNTSFYVASIALDKQTIQYLGSIAPITQEKKIIYKIIIDTSSYFPTAIMQTNSNDSDFTITQFSNAHDKPKSPTELSWYYSTYTKEYTPASKEELTPIPVGSSAPEWTLPSWNKDDSTTLKQFKGKIVLLEFWIKNCGYSIAAVPVINEIYQKFSTKPFEVIGINAYDTKEEIAFFYEKNKPLYPSVYSGEAVTRQYGIDAFPTIVIIDADGKVLYSGSIDKPKIEKVLEETL